MEPEAGAVWSGADVGPGSDGWLTCEPVSEDGLTCAPELEDWVPADCGACEFRSADPVTCALGSNVGLPEDCEPESVLADWVLLACACVSAD